jgi:hypothetical protein
MSPKVFHLKDAVGVVLEYFQNVGVIVFTGDSKEDSPVPERKQTPLKVLINVSRVVLTQGYTADAFFAQYPTP